MLDKVVRNADVADVDNLSFSSSLRIFSSVKLSLWVTFLAETSKVLEIILITTVLSFTNSLSRTYPLVFIHERNKWGEKSAVGLSKA